MADLKHIVVLGAGFGGLTFCQRFRHLNARITLIDRQNHHLFQPLLYQVAGAGLAAPDIAEPIRSILSHREQVTVRLDTALSIDLQERLVRLESGPLAYDYLVLGLGAVTSYFGHDDWAVHAPGLKSLRDALRIRHNVLLAFEQAENETDPVRRRMLTTTVVVGGGPTGVELAGAFAELARHVLRRDFRRVNPAQARIILVEGGDRILTHLSPNLSRRALVQLEHLGVEVRLQSRVRDIQNRQLLLESGESIAAANLIWAAGVEAHPITRTLGVELDRSGRVRVQTDLSLPEHPEVFAVGDIANVPDGHGGTLPGVSPAAMQMAQHVTGILAQELESGRRRDRPPFRYRDKGTMATIGRSAAVAQIGRFEFAGYPAWMAWLFVHLIFLIGFDNKLVVLLQWIYSYCTYKRGARIITGADLNDRS